jgi:hypothetical protein
LFFCLHWLLVLSCLPQRSNPKPVEQLLDQSVTLHNHDTFRETKMRRVSTSRNDFPSGGAAVSWKVCGIYL